MRIPERIAMACLVLLLIASGASSSPSMMDTVEELSSATYAGRLTGTAGNEMAAHYLAAHFAQLGLEPLQGLEDYYQPYRQLTRRPQSPPELAILAGTEQKTLRFLHDFVVAVGQGLTNAGAVQRPGVILHQTADLSAEAIEASHLRTSILLIPEKVFLPNQEAIMQFLMTTAAKPAGIILEADIGDQLFPVSLYINPAEEQTPAQLPLLFSVRSEAFQELIDASEQGFELKMAADYELDETRVSNVVGVMPGSMAGDHHYVIIGAHFDGAGGTIDSFNPSAHDNASGVAVLLECAARLQSAKFEVRPTVVFAAFNGEEQGMYGSAYFAAQWPYPKNTTIMINIDSVGAQSSAYLSIESPPGRATGVRKALLAIARELGLSAIAGESAGSDHRSLADEGIKAINLIQGDFSVMHRPNDTVDVLSEEKLDEVVSLILTYLQRM